MSKKKRPVAALRVAAAVCVEDEARLDARLAQLAETADTLEVVHRTNIGQAVEVPFDEPPAPAVSEADHLVIIATPRLVASGWAFSAEAQAALQRHARGECAIDVVADGADLSGSPLGALVGAAGGPVYEDEPHARLGERLEGLWALARREPDAAGLTAAIAATSRALRRGPTLRAGEQLAEGRFRLLARVGQGALTSVWRARDRDGGATVAVKVLHAHWAADRAHVERFFDAARRTVAVAHPAVPAVIVDQGEQDGFCFFVTAFCDGTPLDRAITDGRVDRYTALQALLDVADGLDAAHHHGLLHRDLRPSSVLVGADGRGSIVDFDMLADLRPGGAGVYAAPERMDPSVTEGPPSDVYGLAMVTMFALHGQPLPVWVLRDPERLVRGLDASDAVKAAIRAGVDWDLDQRTKTAGAFADALLADDELVDRLADAALARGRADAATAHLRRLKERRPDDPSLPLRLGRAQARSGDPADAARTLADALRGPGVRAADVAALIADLRDLCGRTGDPEPLIGALDRAAELDADHSLPWLVEKARLVEAHRDARAAAAAWEHVFALHDTRRVAREALTRLAGLAESRGDANDAVRRLRELLPYADPPERPALAYRIGRIYLDRLRDQEHGLQWLERALEAGHPEPGLAAMLERIRTDRGEWRHAVALLREQARTQPDDEAIVTLTRAAAIAAYGHRDPDTAPGIWQDVLVRDAAHPVATRIAAREATRAGRPDALALWDRAAPADDPAERVADAVAHARLLLAADRRDEALARLDAALAASPGHVDALVMLFDERLDHGELDAARDVGDRLRLALAGRQPSLSRPVLTRLGDLAWLAGDLATAAARYQAALDLAPDDRRAWWGVAKVALRALREPGRGEHLPPWLSSAPGAFGPHEALARLLASLLDAGSMGAWLDLDPMTRAWRAAGDVSDPLLRAAVVVDALERRGLVGPGLFARLADAFLGWSLPIEAVRHLWCEPRSEGGFPVVEAYSWTDGPDFNRWIRRELLWPTAPVAADAPPTRASLVALASDAAWKALLHRQIPPAEIIGADTMEPPPPVDDPIELPRHAVLVAREKQRDEVIFRFDGEQFAIGSGEGDDVRLEDASLGPAHVLLYRCGTRFYAECPTGAGLRVDGRAVSEARLPDDAELTIGDTTLAFHVRMGAAEAPRPIEAVNVAADEDLPDDETEMAPIPAEVRPPRRRAALFYKDALGERMVPFIRDTFVIGRRESDDLSLTADDGARPFRLFRHGDDVFVEDDKVATRLADGQVVQGRPVRSGDRFTVGKREYEFRFLDEVKLAAGAVEDDLPLTSSDELPLGDQHASLVYFDGTPGGRVLSLDEFPFTIGRGRNASFQINVDAKLSRVHCRFDRRDDGFYVSDCKSSNGTRVNGETITEHRLEAGDRVMIGDTEFEFRIERLAREEDLDLGPPIDIEENVDEARMRRAIDDAIAIEEGLEKIRAANQALTIVIRALDQHEGRGRGEQALQLVLAASNGPHKTLADDIDVRGDGLPGLELLFNLSRRPEREQRQLLNTALLDWVERAVSIACDAVPDEQVDGLLEQVARVGYRERLRI